MYTGARFALDVVGWSTAPDDLGVAVSRLDQFFSWLMTIPVWMPFAGAVLLSLALASLSLVNRPRASYVRAEQTIVENETRASAEEPILGVKPRESSMYVGEMRVSARHAADLHMIEITARCFNGSSENLTIVGVTGHIEVSLAEEGSETARIGNLPIPWLMDTVDVSVWPPEREILIALNQRIGDDIYELIESVSGKRYLSLNLENLNILVAPKDYPSLSPVRLKLWSGIRLSRNSDVQCGMIITGIVSVTI